MKILSAILTSIVLLIMLGCNSVPVSPDKDPVNPGALGIPLSKIDDITSRFKTNNTDIGTLSQGISSTAEKIAIANPKIKEAVKVRLDAEKIGFINTENIKNTVGLVDVKDQLVKASEQIDNLKKEVADSKAELQKGMNKILLLVYSLCILGVAAGVVLMFFNQQNNGMIAIGISIAMLGLVYFLQAYAWILGIVSGVFFIGLLGICVFKIYQDQITKRELVKSYEAVKVASKYEAAERLTVTNIQSDNTINEVNKIKKDIGLN